MQASQSALQLSPIGYQDGQCGYCKNKAGSFSYYASAKHLSPEVYQSLIERGWRRSGTILYKPDLKAQCCKHYTIRLNSSAFKPTKDQRQAINRFNRYVLGEEFIRAAARYYPKSRRDAAKRNTDFVLTERIYESELSYLPGRSEQNRPIINGDSGPSAKTPKPPKTLPKLEPAHKFEVTLEVATYTEEKYQLFENYQRLVHKEPPSKITHIGFKRFLCDSPLSHREDVFDGKTRRLGSYHQCYRLDGALVAMAVLDLLPQAVSAVYFMYHESVHEWEFGKLGALREIALSIEEDYTWYMMGYYIHDCVKMRYKADYHPQYVLDPESYTWDILDEEFKQLLSSQKYLSMSRHRELGHDVATQVSNNDDSQEPSKLKQIETPQQYDIESDDDDDSESDEIPLFERDMPGIMKRDQLLAEVELDHISLSVPGHLGETGDLLFWNDSPLDDPRAIKCLVAELASALGPDLTRELCVVFA